MSKKDKPIKIKRYKNTVGGSVQKQRLFTKIIVSVGLAFLLLGVGFVIGKPVIEFFKNVDFSSNQGTKNSDNELPPSLSLPTPDIDVSGNDDNTIVIPTKNRIYYNASIQNLTSATTLDTLIQDIKAKGATHCVITLKNQDGNVHYNSENEYASLLKATTIIDLKLVVDTLLENGITPVANVYTYMDQMISTVARDACVYYQGTDARWLDSSAALGGKAWANPASVTMQNYILDLTQEIVGYGIKEFIFSGFQLPTGYSLDKRDFRVTNEQLLANLRTMITTLEGKINAKGGNVSWQVDYSAINGGGYEQYMISPVDLFGDDLIVTARASQIEDPQAAVDVVNAIKNTQGEHTAVLQVVDADYSTYTSSMTSYFVN